MIRNYFADLELDVSASLDDVKRAYKKLARQFHPDLNPMDAHAEESFRSIQQAFDRLNSVTRIERLRSCLSSSAPKGLVKKEFGRWGNYPLVPDSAEQFMTQWGNEPSIHRPFERPAEQLDFWISINLSAQELKEGTTKRFTLRFEKPCESCRGSGARARSAQATCKRCAGIGHFLIERGAMHWRKTCDECVGKGYIVASPCSHCKGNGKVTSEQIVEFKIFKNTDSAKAVSLKGFGHISFDGKKRGDLWVQLVQKR